MNTLLTNRFMLALALWLVLATSAVANDAYQQQITLTRPATISDSTMPATQCVVLLHGLARTSSSMSKLGDHLVENNFAVVNIDYPSRQFPIEILAANTVPAGIQACQTTGADKVYFVTHSLGGILLRAYTAAESESVIHRAVMLGPPNQGSEVVDSMRDVPGFKWLNGPAGQQLGTDEGNVPPSLGALNFDAAVIAGTSSINPILSSYLPDPDDGKVSVASSRVANMCAHLQMDVSHPYLMKDDEIIAEVVNYFRGGRFSSAAAEYPDCSYR